MMAPINLVAGCSRAVVVAATTTATATATAVASGGVQVQLRSVSISTNLLDGRRRSLSSITANNNTNTSSSLASPVASASSSPSQLLLLDDDDDDDDERTTTSLLSQVSSPLKKKNKNKSKKKRIVCLCPVPLGRGRVSWSGGDDYSFAKYRYGERFAIGVAVSDPYLTHAMPVHLGGGIGGSDDGGSDDGDGCDDYRGDDDNASKERRRGFVAEIVPTFRCDSHNLGTSPIFHTNLPYFRNEFLEHIGHFDVGAVVLAMPMNPTTNPLSSPMPTKVQLEQEQKLAQVRECLVGVMRNYISAEDDDDDDEEEDSTTNTAEEDDDDDDDDVGDDDRDDDDAGNVVGPEQRRRRRPRRLLGPLNVQGHIEHRLSITDVLSKTTTTTTNVNNDCQHGSSSGGSWDHISKLIRRIQNDSNTIIGGRVVGSSGGSGSESGSGRGNYHLGNREHAAHDVFSSVPPEIHAAVALNAMMEKHTRDFHNSFF